MKLEEVISKRDLARILIEPRTAEIKKERNNDGWKPVLPIEKELKKVFHKMG
jgi:hypothetical protein